jgi:hypothetical protein
MSYQPKNPNGQTTMANSTPVVIASDQAALTVASHNVTNAGTFAVQATLAAETTKVIGTVTATQPTGTNLHTVVDSGTVIATQATGTNLHTVVDSGTVVATQATGTNLHMVVDSGIVTTVSTVTNLAQIAGVAPKVVAASTAAIATDPALVVAISPNNTVPVSLASVPTHSVTQATGTNLHTVVDSGTVIAAQATGTNLHTVVDSGTVIATQATGTNLHTVVDSGTVTTVGTVNTVTNLAQIAGVAPKVVAASTAAIATDPALVVAISPNNTIPVSGAFYQTTQPVSIAAMPTTPISDGGGSITVDGTLAVTGTFWQATQPVSGPLTDTQLRATPVPVSGSLTATIGANSTVDLSRVGGVAVVTGGIAGTQGIGGANIVNVVMANAGNPVVMAGAVSTTNPAYTAGNSAYLSLNTSGGLRVDGSGYVQPVSDNNGSLTVDAPVGTPAFVRLSNGTSAIDTLPVTGSVTVSQATGTNLHTVVDSGQVTATQSGVWNIGSITTMPTTTVTGTVAATQSGTWNIGSITTMPSTPVTDSGGSLTVDAPVGTPAFVRLSNGTSAIDTLPVSGTVAATQSGTWNIGSITTMPSTPVTGTFWQTTQPVSGPLTDTQLRATPVPVSGSLSMSANSSVNLSQVGGVTVATGGGVRGTGVQRVSIATDDIVQVGDNGASLTVDAPVGTPAYVRLSNGVSAIDTLPVTGTVAATQSGTWNIGSITTVPSHAVTNIGTFAVQATLAAETTKVIGTVNQGTSPWVTTATLGAETTKVIGTVNIAASQTVTATQATGTNLHTVVDSGTVAATQSGTWNIGSITTMPTTAVTGPLTDTQLRASAVPVSLASVPSHAVTNAGTFAVQVTSAPSTAVTNAGTFAVQASQVPDATSTSAPSNATTTAYATNLVAKAAAGQLYAITGYNSKTTPQFIQVHNTTTLPADTAVPVLVFYVGPTSNFSLDFGGWGRYFSTGITICNSTTGPTKTIGAADCWIDAMYK